MRSKRLSDVVDRPTACRVFRSAAWNTGGAGQKVPYDAIAFDPGGCFNLGQSRYTAPLDGIYHMHHSLTSGSASSQFQPMFYKNGSLLSGGPVWQYTAAGSGCNLVDLQPLKAGDYIEAWVWVGNAAAAIGASSIGVYVWMNIARLGERNV